MVRRDSDLNPVESLEYDAYADMAKTAARGIGARRPATKWPGARIAIEHRLGSVPLGEASVVIAVGTPHRAEAFACCRFLIEELKHRVPIWKKGNRRSGDTLDRGRSTAKLRNRAVKPVHRRPALNARLATKHKSKYD